MREPRRLHPAAIAIYSADALKNLAFPLLVVLGATLLGGSPDVHDLVRTLIYGGGGLVVALRGGVGRRGATPPSLGHGGGKHPHRGPRGDHTPRPPPARG